MMAPFSRSYPSLATRRLPCFVCTALNRNSRIVGQVGSDDFLSCMQSFESALLPLPCGREIFDDSCYADPTRSRCKPRSRSLQIGFYDHWWRFALPCLPAYACSCFLARRFAWLRANLRFVLRMSADSAVSALKIHVPACPRGLLEFYRSALRDLHRRDLEGRRCEESVHEK